MSFSLFSLCIVCYEQGEFVETSTLFIFDVHLLYSQFKEFAFLRLSDQNKPSIIKR